MKRTSRYWLNIGFFLILVGFMLHLASIYVNGRSIFATDAMVVWDLQRTFPFIEEHHTQSYRDQYWCKFYVANRGAFGESTHPSTCFFVEKTEMFGDFSRKEFDRHHDAFQNRLFSRILWMSVKRGFDGNIAQVEFDVSAAFSYRRYIYDPGYTLPASDHNMRFIPINENWYRIDEDAL